MRRVRKQQGVVFVLAMVAMLVLIIAGGLTLQFSLESERQASIAQAYEEALTMADAGVNAAQAYLAAQTTAPAAGTTTYYPGPGQYNTVSLGNGKYRVVITTRTNVYNTWSGCAYVATAYGASNRAVAGASTGKLVTATGASQFITRKVVATLYPQSFSLYGYFEDTGLSNNWWVSGISRFDGPFHTNGKMQIDWTKTATQTIFSDMASSSSTTVTWGSTGAPQTAADYNKIFSGGQSAMQLGANSIPFPGNASVQQAAAWGSTSGFPAASEAYINTTDVTQGGIYINSGGQNCTLAFSVDTSGRQVLTVSHYIKNAQSQWVQKTTLLTIDLVNNTTTRSTKLSTDTNFSTPVTYTGVPNGVLYCTGAITGLSGTLADSYVANNLIVRPNAWTIATDFSSTGKANVTLTNSLQYQHPPDFTKPITDVVNLTAPVLGVLGYQIHVATSCPTNMTMHGVYMASSPSTSGSILVDDIAAQHLRGNLNILGGTIVKTAAILGQYNTSTKTTQYGYNEHYSYDPRMAKGPLRAFPQTNNYDVATWQYQGLYDSTDKIF